MAVNTREPRHRVLPMWSNEFGKMPRLQNVEKTIFLTDGVFGTVDTYMWNHEDIPYLTLYANISKYMFG